MGSIVAIFTGKLSILDIFSSKIYILTMSKLKYFVSKLKFSSQVLLDQNFSGGMALPSI